MGMLRSNVLGKKFLDSHLQMSFMDNLDFEDGASLDIGPAQKDTTVSVRRKSKKRREGKFLDDALQLDLAWDFVFDEDLTGESLSVNGVAEDWTEDELIGLHQYLLEQSMTQALNPRSSKDTRLDVLSWVDVVTPYLSKPAPFSFDACCQFSGYDPEELRDHLHDEMKFRRIHPQI